MGTRLRRVTVQPDTVCVADRDAAGSQPTSHNGREHARQHNVPLEDRFGTPSMEMPCF